MVNQADIAYDRESKVVAPTIYKMGYKTIGGKTYTLPNEEEETNMIRHIVSNALPLRDGFSIIGNTLFDYIPKTFIYDHNVILKGKLSDVVNRYKDLYGDNKAEIDDKGRVIIK